MGKVIAFLIACSAAFAQYTPPPVATFGGTVTTVTGVGPISTTNPTTTPAISCAVASGSIPGCLAAADWTTFNNKQGALGFTPLNAASNLSDLANAATSRTNLGLGSFALKNSLVAADLPNAGVHTGDAIGTFPIVTLNNPSLHAGYLSTTKTADAAGVTANLLVKINATGNVVNAAASDVGILGIAATTATSGNPVEVATRGIISCVADNTTVIGDVVTVGFSTAGRCRDSGFTDSTSVFNNAQVVGKVLTVATVGNLFSVQLYGPGHYGAQVVNGGIAAGTIDLTTKVASTLPAANGGTNCSSPTITCFNNITGFTAAGTTGGTNTNLVFSSNPTFQGTVTVGTAIKVPLITVPTDSTTAFQIDKADGITTMFNVDTTNGRVGFGTTAPTKQFQVHGVLASTTFADNNGQAFITNDGTLNTYSSILFGSLGAVPYAKMAVKFGASGSYMMFGTSNNYSTGITNSAMTIDFSGNVGIGTAAPGTQLQVTQLISGGSAAPGISGCSATIAGNNQSGVITSGTTGTCTVVLTWAASAFYTTGVFCSVADQTTVPALFTGLMKQTAQTVSTVTFSGTTVSGDKLPYSCPVGY